ncbi:MAG: toll/interleukin-1 receptor domain-containing protein [Dactylosporangium sp.]|nr:toll/interleukin-1 receptor domain-containing protein [Dactylosporangium sp.]NNJ60729.1 toll/interleukin-1 receptor domain-containing protein [Dactylosporangium sp.]
MTESVQHYDIAVSFAGAQRARVEPIVRACQALGLQVFYDKDNTVEFWGRNFITDMRAIYGGARARYFVPFLSKEYLASAYPMDEFTTAMRRAIEVGEDNYILPIVVGSVEVPGELLNPAIGFLRLEDYPVDRLAQIIAGRVRAAVERHQEPREITGVVDTAFGVRLPRLAPADFVPIEELETALTRVGSLFQHETDQLAPFGVQCRVRQSDTALDVRAYRQGQQVCGLRLYFPDASAMHNDQLLMTFQWPRITSGGYNGWVTAEWDADAGRPVLEYTDMARGTATPVRATADELFRLLWEKIVDHLEHVR